MARRKPPSPARITFIRAAAGLCLLLEAVVLWSFLETPRLDLSSLPLLIFEVLWALVCLVAFLSPEFFA